MERYTLNMKGRQITIKGEVARAHNLYEGAPIDDMADYYAHLSTGKEDSELLLMPDDELSAAIENGFKSEVLDVSGEKVWIALFEGNMEKASQLLQLPNDKR